MSNPTRNQIAVLVDYENVPASAAGGLAEILTRATEEGTIVMRRAYANWVRFSSHKAQLRSDGFEMIDVATVNGKNGVDIKLVVDAMEIAFTKEHIDTFIIVSGDSDFIPLVVKLNELNRRAWLCLGKKQISPALAKFCFRLAGPDRSQPPARAKAGPTVPKNQPVPSLARATAKFSAAQLDVLRLAIYVCDFVVRPPVPLTWLFGTLRVLDPDFDRESCIGKGKRPQVRMAQRLQELGLLEFNYDRQLGMYLFSADGGFRLLSFPPASHANFEAAVAKLQLRVEERRDGLFQLQPTFPGQPSETDEIANASQPSAGIRLYCTEETYRTSPQLEFSFE